MPLSSEETDTVLLLSPAKRVKNIQFTEEKKTFSFIWFLFFCFYAQIYLVRVDFGTAGSSPVLLQFVTDLSGSGRGFLATFRQVACDVFPTTVPPFTTPPGVTCDRSFRERESFVTSVNYPLPYLRNLDCIYSIEKWIPVLKIHYLYCASIKKK